MTLRVESWRITALVLAFFAVFLVTAQLEHHDLECHLKTPQHCSGCNSSPLGSDPHTLASVLRIVLADAGRAVTVTDLRPGTILTARLSGRSPPLAHVA